MIVNKYANGGGGSTSGVTPQDVQQQINSALTPYWESGETKNYVDSAVSGISLDGYYTSAQTEEAIAEAVEGYATSGDMQSAFTLISETQQVAAAGLNQLEERIDELSGSSVDLSAYYTSAQTEDAISAATSGKADAANVTANNGSQKFPKWNKDGIITGEVSQAYFSSYYYINGVRREPLFNRAADASARINIYAPVSAGTAGDILVSTGNGAPVWSAVTMGGNSNILAAITTQAEYEAISGDVKTGDLIEVEGVDINGDGKSEYGLFGAHQVREEESDGVVRKSIYWERRDNANSVFWSDGDYPWMPQNSMNPIDFYNAFLICYDATAEDEAYNGIGFDEDGKPIITHFAPEYDEETGEVTGITREDTPIGGGADMSAYYTSAQTENAIAQAVSGLATEQYVQDALSGANMDNYYTSAQTEEAIAEATAGKADAANIAANTGNYIFPKWNNQGIISGVSQQVFKSYLDVNDGGTGGYFFMNTSKYDAQNKALKIYTPLSAGTAGDILVSTGNGAPVWSAVTFPDASNYVTSAQVETQIEAKNYVNSGDVKSQVEAYNYATVSQIPTVPTSNTAFTNDAGYITSAAIADKVSSTSVSTIWKGTQADYDDIPTKDPNTFYIIL